MSSQNVKQHIQVLQYQRCGKQCQHGLKHHQTTKLILNFGKYSTEKGSYSISFFVYFMCKSSVWEHLEDGKRHNYFNSNWNNYDKVSMLYLIYVNISIFEKNDEYQRWLGWLEFVIFSKVKMIYMKWIRDVERNYEFVLIIWHDLTSTYYKSFNPNCCYNYDTKF